ncbi:MAG: hypothetical protein Kow00108_16720 [Calditrichia bacterium]
MHYPFTSANMNILHSFINARANRPENFILDINGQHIIKNYYKYRIELDHFHCNNDNEWEDEPYFMIYASYPTMDISEADNLKQAMHEDAYKFHYDITRTWGGVDSGEDRAFREEDNPILNHNTFNSTFSFTIDMWESDCSRWAVVGEASKIFRDIQHSIGEDIRNAIENEIKNIIIGIIGEIAHEVMDEFMSFLSGALTNIDLLNIIDNVYGGIDISWINIISIFSGADFLQSLAGMGLDPTSIIVILGLKVGIPALVDFFSDLFSGDIAGAFEAMFMIPYRILEMIWNAFTNIIDFFKNLGELIKYLFAIMDPDDHIGEAKTVQLTGSHESIFDDHPNWNHNNNSMVGYNLSSARSFRQTHGWGAIPENNSFIQRNIIYQPSIRFHSGGTDYTVFYNVKRNLVGGIETFGYTLMPGDSARKIMYHVKSPNYRAKMKIILMALNSDAVPFIVITPKAESGPPVNFPTVYTTQDNTYQFEVETWPNMDYEITLFNASNIPLYGYLCIKEEN